MKQFICYVTTLLVCVTATSASAASLTVRKGGDLQQALNAAKPGDTILLAADAVFTGNFVLPAKQGSGVITIRAETPDNQLPAPGVRMTPNYAPVLPKIRANSNGPALRTAAGASGWRLLFLEVLPAPGTSTAVLVELGRTGTAQTTAAQVPGNIEVDRCFFHGDSNAGQRRGIGLNSASTRVTNSYFSDFKGKGVDTQAIAGWNGPGPFLIENNYLEAAGEIVMFGGADPTIANLVPSNITIRRNLFSRPLTWMQEAWTVKNLLELKNAEHVVVEGNEFENHWTRDQQGPAIVFTPRNQDKTAPWSVVRHVVFQNNVVHHVASVFNILGYDNAAPTQRTEDILIRNNLIYDVKTTYTATAAAAPGGLLVMGAGPLDVRLDHNTVDNSGGTSIMLYAGRSPWGPQMPGFELTNNLLRHNSYAVYGDKVGEGQTGLAHYAPSGIVLQNAFAGSSAKRYPTGNVFPTVAQWLADFVRPQAGDYHLASGSASRSAASDGTDLGVDFTELAAAFAGGVTAPSALPAPTSPPPAPAPYGSAPSAVQGRVEAENYDIGGAGVAFQDASPSNEGGAYRQDAVDIQPATDTGGGYDVAWTTAGEWLTYSVQTLRSGSFVVDVRVASRDIGGTFYVEVDGTNVSGSMSVPDTGGWQTWKTISSRSVSLSAGAHIVRLVMDTTGARGFVANFNWFALR